MAVSGQLSAVSQSSLLTAWVWQYSRAKASSKRAPTIDPRLAAARRAIRPGDIVTPFDFGRSSADSGTYRFKKQWGAQPQPTVWQYHVRRGDIQAVRPDSPRYRRRIEVWQKLPVWLTRLIGPSIVRGIP